MSDTVTTRKPFVEADEAKVEDELGRVHFHYVRVLLRWYDRNSVCVGVDMPPAGLGPTFCGTIRAHLPIGMIDLPRGPLPINWCGSCIKVAQEIVERVSGAQNV